MVLTRNERANQSRAWRSRGSRRSPYRRRIRLASSWVGMGLLLGRRVYHRSRSDVLTVRAPKDPFKLEADGDKVQPGAVAELGVNTFEPFGVSGGRITLTWDARLSGGAPTVKLDPRYGKSTFTVDSSKPRRLVVDFKSPDSSFNSTPGTIVSTSLPISPSASIGPGTPFTLNPA